MKTDAAKLLTLLDGLMDEWEQERSNWADDLETDKNDIVARYVINIFANHISELKRVIAEGTNENGLGIVETAQTADTTDECKR